MTHLKALLFLLFLEPLVSSGRIGRIKLLGLFLLALWPLILARVLHDEAAAQWFQNAVGVLAVAGLVFLWVALLATFIRRLHDVGRSGLWVLLVAVLWPLLMVWPGQNRANHYGPPPSPFALRPLPAQGQA
ncbi:MAG: DUF805 domain-containing protein [Pseudomonas sp.]|uniref:DUF805 domain-containing protein n=1 Tax=Pseudomonas sp. TaxID=306 RepID=UPI003D09D9A8